MKKEYVHYTDITREILDTIKVGDLVKINDWTKPLRVKAVSENYFVMVSNLFGKPMYSVCSKLPWKGVRHNAMTGGMFHCGADNWIFGSPYHFSMRTYTVLRTKKQIKHICRNLKMERLKFQKETVFPFMICM